MRRSNSSARYTPSILSLSSMRVMARVVGTPVPSLSSHRLDFLILCKIIDHQKQTTLFTNQTSFEWSYCIGGVGRLVCILVLVFRVLVLTAGVGQVEFGQHHVLIVVCVILRFLCVIQRLGVSIMWGNRRPINVKYVLNTVPTIHNGLLHRLYPGHDLSQVSERGIRTGHHLQDKITGSLFIHWLSSVRKEMFGQSLTIPRVTH